MASDVVVFQIQTFLNSLEELTPNLPLTLSTEFDQIKNRIEGANLVNKHVWPYSAAPASASSSLLPLLNDLNDLLAECSVYAEQSQNVSEGLPSCHYNAFHQTFSVRKMKQKLKSKKDKLAEKITELGDSSLPSMGMGLFPTSRYTSIESKPDFQIIGFDEEEKKIEGLLSDNSYKAIGVYGMAGSGKTALILKVLNSPTVQNRFSPIIWLCLSDIHSQDQEDPEHFELSIVKFILCELGCDVDKWTNTNPSKAYLLKHLKNLLMSKKYLIVFDDVWEDNEFYADLGDALPGSDIVYNRLSEALPRDGGGKIIMTSRQKEVGKKMVGEKNLICMKPLSRESCRMILENEIGLTGCVKKIEGWLNGSGFVSIGIYGPSSSANMAVVRKVLSNPSVRGKFQHIIWVPVSLIFLNHHQIHPGDEIMKHTLKELGCDDELTKNKSGLNLREIVNQSLRSKKYMIVLSDVVYGNNNFWRLISSAWPKDGDGTILVTSKTKELTEYLVGENLVHMRFPTKSKTDEGGDVIAIDHQCCGLPYPAKMMFEYEILEYAKEIEGWLINGSEYVSIGIYGPSSSANTAVARMVLSSPSVRETFEPIIWVPVSLIFLNYDQINAWNDPWYIGDEVWREFMNAGDEIAKLVLKELGYDEELTKKQNGV